MMQSSAPGSLQRKPSFDEPGSVDLHELLTRRLMVGRVSGVLCCLLAAILLTGQFYLHRQVGPFVIINIGMTVIFGYGAMSSWLNVDMRGSSLTFLQWYYAFVTITVVCGVPIGLYQLSNNPERVDSFCADRPSSCTDTQRSTLLTMSYVVGVVGIIMFFLLMTLLMRMIFILMVALERANLQARPENIHAWVRFSFFRRLRSSYFIAYCNSSKIRVCDSQCCRLGC
jgi:hypothetical protein